MADKTKGSVKERRTHLASIREAIEWIAINIVETDDKGNVYSSLDFDTIRQYPTVHLIAHIFRKGPEEIAFKVQRYREEKLPVEGDSSPTGEDDGEEKTDEKKPKRGRGRPALKKTAPADDLSGTAIA